MISPIYNGLTQPYVGFQINIDRTAYFTGKVHALDGLEVRGNFFVPNNAKITTLEVYQTSYLKNTEIDGTLKINNVNTDTLYQTRAWLSLKVSYKSSNQTPITVY